MSDIIAGIFLFVALLSATVPSFQLVTALVRLGRLPPTWEIRILATALLLASLLVLIIEATSLLRLLSAFGLAAGWLIASVLLHTALQKLEAPPADAPAAPALFTPAGHDLDPEAKWLRYGIAWILAVLFVIAFFTPPTARDPLSGDLVRLLHWIQNGSVAPYSTNDLSTLRQSPLPAFAFLHAFLLSGSDQLVKLVPWLATVLTLLALSALAALVSDSGRNPQAKLWTAAAGLALLLTFNLAPSPANSFGAFFLVLLSVFGLVLKREPGNVLCASAVGVIAALCFLTDSLLGLLALILAFFFVFSSTTRAHTGKSRLILAMLLPILLLAGPQSLRHYTVFGFPFSFTPSSTTHLRLLLLLVLPFFGVRIIGGGARRAFGLGFIVLAITALLLDRTQPILTAGDFILQPRERQRFHGATQYYQPAAQAADDIILSGVTNIALHVSPAPDPLADVEYAFRAMLNGRGFDGTVPEAGVTNQTRRFSSPPSPQALITAAPNIDSLDIPLPYKLNYGPLASHWSEFDSRWFQLSELQPDKSRRILSSTGQEVILFHKNAAILSCRVPRQGVLTLDAGFGHPQGLIESATALSVRSRAGFMTTSRSTNALHLVEIPLPPGQTDFQLAPAFELPTNGLLALRSWSWYPTEQPLPFISVSKITTPSTSLEPNTFLLGAGSDLTIELISGAVGIIDLHIYARGVDAVPVDIANNFLRTNAAFRTGVAIARLSIHRGTNQFTISSPSTNSFVIDRITPRFRDFVE